jgi:vacuolar-type H+-ATPase subunit H
LPQNQPKVSDDALNQFGNEAPEEADDALRRVEDEALRRVEEYLNAGRQQGDAE